MSEISEILMSLRTATAEQKLTIKQGLINKLRPYTQIMNFLPEDPTSEDVDHLFEALENMPHPDLNDFYLNFKKVPVPIVVYILDKIAKNKTLFSLELIDFLQPDESVSHALLQMLNTNNTLEQLRFVHSGDDTVPFPAAQVINFAEKKKLRVGLGGYLIQKVDLVEADIPAAPLLNPIPSPVNQPVKTEEEPNPPIPSSKSQPMKTEEERKRSTQRAKITPIHCLAAIVIAAAILYIAAAPLVLSAILLGGFTLASIVYFGLVKANKPASATNHSAHATHSQTPPQTVPTVENKPKFVPPITSADEPSHQKLAYSPLKN